MAEAKTADGEQRRRPERKSLMDLQSEATIRDPGAHAAHQVKELDKTANELKSNRSGRAKQIESDRARIRHLEKQMAMIHERYDPLCRHIDERKRQRNQIHQALEQCSEAQQKIMGDAKETMRARRQEGSRTFKAYASGQLVANRGFSTLAMSTFRPSAPSEYALTRATPLTSSAATLPVLGQTGGAQSTEGGGEQGMGARSYSSTM